MSSGLTRSRRGVEGKLSTGPPRRSRPPVRITNRSCSSGIKSTALRPSILKLNSERNVTFRPSTSLSLLNVILNTSHAHFLSLSNANYRRHGYKWHSAGQTRTNEADGVGIGSFADEIATVDRLAPPECASIKPNQRANETNQCRLDVFSESRRCVRKSIIPS